MLMPLDMHMARATGEKRTEPTHYPSIFERGIDPDVDNPENCHAHSTIPDQWPPMEEILNFQGKVRGRVRALSKSTMANTNRKLARALWLVFEHDAMHLETFLYMLLQSQRVLPPPGYQTPDFSTLAAKARQQAIPNQWFRIPSSALKLGLNDPDNDLGPDRFFGWDNERPARTVHVGPFEAQARPITNREYARYLEKTQIAIFPASWSIGTDCTLNGFPNGKISKASDAQIEANTPSARFMDDKAIRTIYGLVPLELALDWPVMASYDELAAYAKWANGRIPTLEEARSIYNYVETLKGEDAEKVQSPLISAVNGYISGLQQL